MKKYLFLILLQSIVFAHPHHHSLAILDYNINSQQFELSLKLLTEDYKRIKKDISQYVNHHLKIAIAKKLLVLNLQGEEISPEDSWLYFTAEFSCKTLDSATYIKVENTILTLTNHNQFNTVKINNDKEQITHNFSSEEKLYSFKIKNYNLNCLNSL